MVVETDSNNKEGHTKIPVEPPSHSTEGATASRSNQDQTEGDTDAALDVNVSSSRTFTQEEAEALAHLAVRIQRDGRAALWVKCPHCGAEDYTRLQYSDNLVAEANMCHRLEFVAMLMGVYIVIVFIVGLKSGIVYALVATFVVAFLYAAILLLSCHCSRDERKDVTHFCPQCGKELGVNNGQDQIDIYDRWRGC